MIIIRLSLIFNRVLQMADRYIRIRLKEEQFRKYKVLCAMDDVSMTDKTNQIVRQFIEEAGKHVKIIKTD